MKSIKTLLLLLFLLLNGLHAQLPDGTISPNFIVVDIEGNTWNLYDVLDQGKFVILDISATWCPPCWDIHEAHVLKNFYDIYGPEGTDEAMVFFVESDADTNVDCLYGPANCNDATQGNWVEDTPYPIVNDDSFNDLFELPYYPTFYFICSNRTLREVHLSSSSTPGYIYSLNNFGCMAPDGINNAGIIDYYQYNSYDNCGSMDFTPTYTVQNLGSSNITSATFELWLDGSLYQTINWTGDLAPLLTIDVLFDNLYLIEDADFDMYITEVNNTDDDDLSNNSVSSTIGFDYFTTSNFIRLEIQTDDNPTEIYWEIRGDNDDSWVVQDDNLLYIGGNHSISNLTTYLEPNTLYTHELVLPQDNCYYFSIGDRREDGICCTSGEGYFRMLDQSNNLIFDYENFFGSKYIHFFLDNTESLENNAGLISKNREVDVSCSPLIYTPEFILQNLGSNIIDNVEIEMTSPFTSTILEYNNLNLIAGDSDTFYLAPVAVDQTSNFSYSILSVNGQQDIYEQSNQTLVTVNKYQTQETNLNLHLQLDKKAYEAYWQLTNSTGEIVAYGGNETVGVNGGGLGDADPDHPSAYEENELVIIPLVLPEVEDCYDLRIVDSQGNGFIRQLGYFMITDNLGDTIIFKELDVIQFDTYTRSIFVDDEVVNTTNHSIFQQSLKLIPNPVATTCQVAFTIDQASDLVINVRDTYGKLIIQVAKNHFHGGEHAISFDTANLTNGLYFVELINGQDKSLHKLIKMD